MNNNKTDIILIEKQTDAGLSKDEIIAMCDYFDDEVYPIEIPALTADCSAMGFITDTAANVLAYDYKSSGLNDFIGRILDDINSETPNKNYHFRGLNIKLTRNI